MNSSARWVYYKLPVSINCSNSMIMLLGDLATSKLRLFTKVDSSKLEMAGFVYFSDNIHTFPFFSAFSSVQCKILNLSYILLCFIHNLLIIT